MVTILERAPEFRTTAVDGTGRPIEVGSADFAGGWLVLAFYPRDFTTVCPTEILELSRRARELDGLGARVLAVSVDDADTHRRWIAEKLGPIAFPLASDPGGVIARRYGVLLAAQGVAARATFLVDPQGVVQHVSVHPLDVGRSVSELVRVLEALRSGERAPADWRPGTPTLGRRA